MYEDKMRKMRQELQKLNDMNKQLDDEVCF